MDYEKKYNEAMLRADEAVQKGCLDKDMFDIIFPPEESEDERNDRMRGRVIESLVCYRGKVYDEGDKEVALLVDEEIAWMKKQKEQKPISQGDFDKAKHEALWGEQKPVEKQDYSGLNDLERAIHRGFLCAGVENVPVTIIKETAQDCLAHMPAWSEEDEEMIDRICANLEYLVKEAGSDSKLKEKLEERIKWMKRLKSLRHVWKPTEEQMEALRRAVNKLANTDVADSVRLSIMYDNLKKL